LGIEFPEKQELRMDAKKETALMIQE